jgi:hypothetical protein
LEPQIHNAWHNLLPFDKVVYGIKHFYEENVMCYSNVLLMSSNCVVAFKITNKLKVNNDNLKFNSDFKSHITVEKTPGEH